MKILLLSHAAPFPPDLGPAQRMYHELVEMLKYHRVSVLSFGTPEEEANFRKHFGSACDHVVYVNIIRSKWGNRLLRLWYLVTGRALSRHFHRREFQRALDRLVASEKFDIIQCSTQLLGYYKFPKGIPLIGDTHNVEYDSAYRAYRLAKNPILKFLFFHLYVTLKREEIANCRKFDVLLPISERDLTVFRKDLPDKPMVVIPNGLNEKFFAPQEVSPEPKTLVFTGLMDYYPNEHGMLYFLDDIFPRILEKVPGARIYITGAKPTKKLLSRASDNIIVTGYVDDVRPYVGRAEVYVVPLLMGGGTRQKVLLAMGMKKPIVTTTIGAEGINLVPDDSALFADTPEDFANAVIKLFSDPNLRGRLADSAHAVLHSEYRWESIGQKLNTVYDTLVPSRTTAEPGKNSRMHYDSLKRTASRKTQV